MNLTHLHLLIAHLPIFGVFLGALVLIHGLYTDSHQTSLASYLILLISCLGGFIAYKTGDFAEETVELIQGISISMIESHEESAELSVIGLGILGIFALFALVLNVRLMAFRRTIAIVLLVITTICFALVARTGYLGGQIRHTEVSSLHNP